MLKNAAIYLSGSLVAQLLMLAAIPILSRFYSPEDFGVFGLFSNVLSILGVAACLRFSLAIQLPRKNRHAAPVLFAGLLALLAICGAVLFVVTIGRKTIATWLGAPALANLLLLMPLSVLGYGLYELLNCWSTRCGRFATLAVSQVSRSAGVVGTQLSVATTFGGGLGLVSGQLFGQWVANGLLFVQILRADRRLLASGVSVKRICVQARRYRTFPLHSAPQALLSAISQSAPVIMLGWFFAPAVVGYYVMAQRVISVPITLISQSLRQAMLPSISRRRHAGNEPGALLWKYTICLAVVGLPAVFVLFFYGEALFVFVLGNEWAEAGRYARWLILGLYAGMTNVPSVVVLTVLEKQKVQALYEALFLLARVLSIASAAWTKSVTSTVVLFSLTGLIFNFALVFIAHTKCRAVQRYE